MQDLDVRAVLRGAKAAAKWLAPPILVRGLALVRRPRAPDVPRFAEWEYLPQGWPGPAAQTGTRGWNVRDIAQVYESKWPRFVALVSGANPLGVAHESDLAGGTDLVAHNTAMVFCYALALAARARDSIALLDWGGGCGHYAVLAQAAVPGLRLEYHCRDVPVLADLGRRLQPQHSFHSDDACLLRTYDFVLASASLHYSRDWRATLRGLAGATRGYLLVTRLPTVDGSGSYVFVQRPYAYGYDTEYPGWCLDRAEFMDVCRKMGLTLAREFVIGEAPPIPSAPGPCVYRGFLFRSAAREERT